VLTQGLCGLRPGEAQALRRGDLRVTSTRDAAIVARATHSAVPTKFFLDGEDRRRPLKGRGVHSQRSIPVPEELAGVLRRHLDQWAQPDPGGLVFTNTQGGRINLSNFHRDVWTPAREATFPASSPLRQVRPHDLRHAAITTFQRRSPPQDRAGMERPQDPLGPP
jgi:integrase